MQQGTESEEEPCLPFGQVINCMRGLIFFKCEEINAPKHSESSHTSYVTLLPFNTMEKFYNTGHCIKFYKGPHISNKDSSEYEL